MLALVVLFAVAAAEPPSEAATGPCANPRAAAATILANLREDRLDLRRAARCVEVSSDLTRSQRETAVLTLKRALDAVGARIRIDDIPDAEGYLDNRSFEPVVTLARELPRVRLERMGDGQWMIPASVLATADLIYDDAVAFDLHRLQKTFPAWSKASLLGVAVWQGLGLVLLLALGLLLRFVVTLVLLWQSEALLKALSLTTPPDQMLRPLAPLGTLVLCGLMMIAVPSLSLPGGVASFVMVTLRVVAAVTALRFAWLAVDVAADQMTRRALSTVERMDDHIVPLIRRMLKIAVVTLAGGLVLQTLGVNVGSLVAGLGIGGLAVALAAKDTIGNFFGSVAIFLDRPFQLGDWLKAGDLEGTVEHVGFRSTQIRTVRDTVVSVPNAKLADSNLDNWGARRARQVRWMMGLEHGASAEQVEAFCDGVRAILTAHPHTRKEDIEVHLNDVSNGALSFLVQFYILRPAWAGELRAQHEVLLDVLRLTNDIGMTFVYQTRSVRMLGEPRPAPDLDELLEVIKSYGPGGAKLQPPGPRILPAPPSEPMPAPIDTGAPARIP